MDPTLVQCEVLTSFSPDIRQIEHLGEDGDPPMGDKPYQGATGGLVADLRPASAEDQPTIQPWLVDEYLLNRLLERRNYYLVTDQLLDRAELQLGINPFEQLDYSGWVASGEGKIITLADRPYLNRAGLKLWNLDGVFRFALPTGLPLEQFVFLDLGAAPGAWSQYLINRVPISTGYMVSKSANQGGLEYHRDISKVTQLQPARLQPLVEDDAGVGGLWEKYRQVVIMIQAKEPLGIHLITSDIGVEAPSAGGQLAATGGHIAQELHQLPLLLAQLLIAIKVLIPDRGVLVAKFYTAYTRATAEVLYLIASSFQQFYIIKPVTSRPGNDEHYLVARNPNNSQLELVEQLLDNWPTARDSPTPSYPVQLLADGLPVEFTDFLLQRNTLYCQQQLQSISLAIALAVSKVASREQTAGDDPVEVARVLQSKNYQLAKLPLEELVDAVKGYRPPLYNVELAPAYWS